VIRLTVNGVTGIGLTPHVTKRQTREILTTLVGSKRYALVDIALSRRVSKFINMMSAAGHSVAVIRDHHKDDRQPDLRFNRIELSNRLGPRATVVSRKASRSSTRLVEDREWIKDDIPLVFFSPDPDGILSFIKGAGVRYPELESDADCIDAVLQGRSLSLKGRWLMKAIKRLAPHFSYNPVLHDNVKTEIIQVFVELITKGRTPAVELLEERAELARGIVNRNTEELVDATVRKSPGILLGDARPLIKAQRLFDSARWSYLSYKRLGPGLTCLVESHPNTGDWVHIMVPRPLRDRVDLDKYIGFVGGPNHVHVPNRTSVPMSHFDRFCWGVEDDVNMLS
jgi:hypothetical protein